MFKKKVTTIGDELQADTPNIGSSSLAMETHDKQAELKDFASFFDLLSQIDTRLKEEDPEYKARYYAGD